MWEESFVDPLKTIITFIFHLIVPFHKREWLMVRLGLLFAKQLCNITVGSFSLDSDQGLPSRPCCPSHKIEIRILPTPLTV